MSVTVKTQAELDAALAARESVIYIASPDGVWLRVSNTESSHVVAWESSHVEASGSSHVVAWESSHVVAWESSHVEASGSSHVVASGSSHVEASGSSHVVASGSSHVVASKYVGIHLHSQLVQLSGGQVIDCTEIDYSDPATWCEFYGAKAEKNIAYVYKAVNESWTTDRGIDYSPGSKPEAPDWSTAAVCGQGLHFCAHPIKSLGYLGLPVDKARFVRVGVRLDEMVCLGDKIKAKRVVKKCVEVNRYGEVI